jgi:hypothetical protein
MLAAAAFSGLAQVSAIVPVTHGATAALVDDDGLVLPVLDYERRCRRHSRTTRSSGRPIPPRFAATAGGPEPGTAAGLAGAALPQNEFGVRGIS